MSKELAEKASDLGKAVVWAITMALIMAVVISLVFAGFPPAARNEAELIRSMQHRGMVAVSLMVLILTLPIRYMGLRDERTLKQLGGQ